MVTINYGFSISTKARLEILVTDQETMKNVIAVELNLDSFEKPPFKLKKD